jgi:hypothetical protein
MFGMSHIGLVFNVEFVMCCPAGGGGAAAGPPPPCWSLWVSQPCPSADCVQATGGSGHWLIDGVRCCGGVLQQDPCHHILYARLRAKLLGPTHGELARSDPSASSQSFLFRLWSACSPARPLTSRPLGSPARSKPAGGGVEGGIGHLFSFEVSTDSCIVHG